MSQPTQLPTPAPGGGGGEVGVSLTSSNLIGPTGWPLNAALRQALKTEGPATLGVFRFSGRGETFYALGVWVHPHQRRPPARRQTGYAVRRVALYHALDRRELVPLLAGLVEMAPAWEPARPLGLAHCFGDPWPVLNHLPVGARRAGPAVVWGPAASRPLSPRVRGLRRRLAEAEARLVALEGVRVGDKAKVGLPTAPRLWLTLPVGAEVLAAARKQVEAEVQELREQLLF